MRVTDTIGRIEGMEGLKIIESSIVPVYSDKEDRILVNARDLHTFLESGQEFAHWIRHRLGKYGFLEGEDYLITLSNKDSEGLDSPRRLGKPRTDYLLSFDTAKEIAMLENNDRGRRIRRYFIECERRLRTAGGVINIENAEKLKQRAKRLDIMERNARSRQACILKSAAEFFRAILSDSSMRAIVAEIAALITGKRLVDPPEAEKLYSAAEIGEMYGMNTGTIERIVSLLGLKTDEYGMFLLTEDLENTDQELVFYYKREVMDRIQEFLCPADCTREHKEAPLEEEFNLGAASL
jgi:phage anti-repressor protein